MSKGIALQIRQWIVACAVLLAPSAWAETPYILLHSTTSTENSGLFAHVLPRFTQDTGIDVRVVAVGTGQALRNGQNGDADVLLVHAKDAELAFIKAGYGSRRHDVMYNDFVLIGPRDDPADTKTAASALDALTRIAQQNAIFISRGDDSGTHKAELLLWEDARVDVAAQSGTWYRETGSGMGATLNIAIGMNGYALTDRATWLAFGNKGAHDILLQGDAALFNQYGVILVNAERHPHLRAQEAQDFVDWLISKRGQAAIASFTLNGTQLFFPNAQ